MNAKDLMIAELREERRKLKAELRIVNAQAALLRSQLKPFAGRRLAMFPAHQGRCQPKEDGKYCPHPVTFTDSAETADLVTSLMIGTVDTHMPVIDLDFPVRAVQSHTPGHSHLYLDKVIPHHHYDELLAVLVKVGMVEEGYYKAWQNRGHTSVRHPDRLDSSPSKNDEPEPF